MTLCPIDIGLAGCRAGFSPASAFEISEIGQKTAELWAAEEKTGTLHLLGKPQEPSEGLGVWRHFEEWSRLYPGLQQKNSLSGSIDEKKIIEVSVHKIEFRSPIVRLTRKIRLKSTKHFRELRFCNNLE